jgi:hypothetical protein
MWNGVERFDRRLQFRRQFLSSGIDQAISGNGCIVGIDCAAASSGSEFQLPSVPYSLPQIDAELLPDPFAKLVLEIVKVFGKRQGQQR